VADEQGWSMNTTNNFPSTVPYTIYDPHGNVLGSGNIPTGTSAIGGNYTSHAGTCTIMIAPGNATGNVILSPVANFTAVLTVPAAGMTGPVVQVPASGNLLLGQNAILTFGGTQGQVLSFNMSNSTIGSSSSSCGATLYDPANNVVGTGNCGAQTGNDLMVPVTLASTGAYKLYIHPQGNAIGSVSVSINNDQPFVAQAAIGGGAVPLTTSVAGQNAYLTFGATANQIITVLMSNGTYPGCSVTQAGVNITINNPDGSRLASKLLLLKKFRREMRIMSNNPGAKAVALFMLVIISLQPAWPMPLQITIPPSGNTSLPAHVLPGQSVTLLPSGQWLLLGGQGKNSTLSTATIQSPLTGATETLKTGMLFARAWHSATLLPDGRVLIIGGTGPNKNVVPTAEILDPTSLTTGVTVTGIVPRARHAATLLTDGSVLIAGGVGNDGAPVASVERWDSQANRTSVQPTELVSGRRDHVATLLPDGTVLLWGGTDAQGNPPSYADLYNPDTQRFISSAFTFPTTPDMNVPYLETSLPTDGATQVPTKPTIGLRFSKALQVQTVNAGSVTLTGPNGEVPVRVLPAEGGRLGFMMPVSIESR
jgi:hypothetical protein